MLVKVIQLYTCQGLAGVSTVSAIWPIQSTSHNVRMLSPGKPASQLTGDLWLKSVSLILANKKSVKFSELFDIFWIFGSLQTCLLFKVGELAGAGCVAVDILVLMTGNM